jgi:arginyl-tRNA synthetase
VRHTHFQASSNTAREEADVLYSNSHVVDDSFPLSKVAATLRSSGYETVTVDPARKPVLGSDAAFIMPSSNWRQDENGASFIRSLEDLDCISSISTKGQRVAVRFTDASMMAAAQSIMSGLNCLHAPPGMRYVVEYCGPNLNKALHVGHLRNVALGTAVTALLNAVGIEVVQQSLICDIGRCICEALVNYNPADYTPAHGKIDHFVGDGYARYVASIADKANSSDPIDPVLRETVMHEDEADTLLSKWMSEDELTRSRWKQMTNAVFDAQLQTLLRLDVGFDRFLYESDSIADCEEIVNYGLNSGLFSLDVSDAVLYRTGRDDYPVMVVKRSDGFPTEHIRMMALWKQHDRTGEKFDGYIDVMGNEWLPARAVREYLYSLVPPFAPMKNYLKLPYGMVQVDGDQMKSSSGNTVLVDNILDCLMSAPELEHIDTAARMEIVPIISIGYFLSRKDTDAIAFRVSDLLDEDANPAWVIAQVMTQTAGTSETDLPDSDLRDPNCRYVILQGLRLPRIIQNAAQDLAPYRVIRYLHPLCKWYLQINEATTYAPVMRSILSQALRAIGLVKASTG